MIKAKVFLLTSVSLIALSSCSTTGDNDALKTISKLLGGQQDQSVFKDTTVKEALEYEYRVCLGDYQGERDKMKACVEEAYAKVVEEKGIGERPTGGDVIIREVEDDEVINEDSQDGENGDSEDDGGDQ